MPPSVQGKEAQKEGYRGGRAGRRKGHEGREVPRDVAQGDGRGGTEARLPVQRQVDALSNSVLWNE